MRKSETEKTIEAIHLLFSKECGGVVRLARNIISKLKNLKREIDIVDIKNAVYAETDNITTMGVIRARKIRNELNDEQKKEFDRFVRDVVLSSKKTFSTKFYDVVDNGLTYIINNDYHLVHQAAYRVFLKLYSYNELPTIDLVDPNNVSNDNKRPEDCFIEHNLVLFDTFLFFFF